MSHGILVLTGLVQPFTPIVFLPIQQTGNPLRLSRLTSISYSRFICNNCTTPWFYLFTVKLKIISFFFLNPYEPEEDSFDDLPCVRCLLLLLLLRVLCIFSGLHSLAICCCSCSIAAHLQTHRRTNMWSPQGSIITLLIIPIEVFSAQ